MFFQITALALLATSASATVIPWTWSVTSFSSVCSAATCRYSFDLSAPTGPSGQPLFDAKFCSGTSVQGGYKPCGVVGIAVDRGVELDIFAGIVFLIAFDLPVFFGGSAFGVLAFMVSGISIADLTF
ncbi:hypothetical protein G6011_00044 [Alternaria panax]|uniref:Uncharacterized protein n=1 Tax=Alternaria panax TaxID=48097 RepID=A0AAD4II34_9PLEO|nr:hypothetical protein G6011_00044 [Alternaria panax]